jgi:1-acyl-sn-glycerol-3-phosphate acyltransferase
MRRNSFVYAVTKKTAQFVFSLRYRIETQKGEALPSEGPAVILPKHQYWTDIPIVSIVFEPLLHFVAKQELFETPLVRGYLSLLGGIPVDRKRTVRTLRSFRYLLPLLRSGEKIVIFPEGTYCRGGVGSGKTRLIEMVLKFQSKLGYRIPFIPVGIRYGERVRWRRKVEVSIGPALFAEDESEAVSLTRRVMEEISRLSRLPLIIAECGMEIAPACRQAGNSE